jgi:hypothetical protein
VYWEQQFLRLCRHTRIMVRHQWRGICENQHWQNETVLHWEGLFKKITELLQHRWEQNWIVFILKTLFPQKLSDTSFTNPASTVGLQLLNLRLLKVMLRCVNNGVMTIKCGHQTTRNARVMWSFTLFPISGRVYVWRTPKEAYNLECLVQTVKQGGVLSCFCSNIMVQYSVGSIINLSWLNYCKGVCEQIG